MSSVNRIPKEVIKDDSNFHFVDSFDNKNFQIILISYCIAFVLRLPCSLSEVPRYFRPIKCDKLAMNVTVTGASVQ